MNPTRIQTTVNTDDVDKTRMYGNSWNRAHEPRKAVGTGTEEEGIEVKVVKAK